MLRKYQEIILNNRKNQRNQLNLPNKQNPQPTPTPIQTNNNNLNNNNTNT